MPLKLNLSNVWNFIIPHKLGLKYRWKVRLWGDIFTIENEKKYLKEIVANGNIALLPKLMSAEEISVRDTKALATYVKSFGFYDDFMTYTQLKNAELAQEATESGEEEVDEEGGEGVKRVGRPEISDGDVDNEATASSKDNGTNTSDNREQ